MAARETRAILLLLLLAGCGGDGGESAATEAADTVASGPQFQQLSDNEALDVLMAVSAAGLSAANAVPAETTSPEVRRYLAVVRADHEALQAELKVIADSLQLTPEAHAAGERVRTAVAGASAAEAQPTEGVPDTEVLAGQRDLHRLFLAVLDSAVLRGPREALLAQYAGAMRPTVSAHLQRAEQLERLLRAQPTAQPVRAAAPGVFAPAASESVAQPVTIPDTARRTPPDTVPNG